MLLSELEERASATEAQGPVDANREASLIPSAPNHRVVAMAATGLIVIETVLAGTATSLRLLSIRVFLDRITEPLVLSGCVAPEWAL